MQQSKASTASNSLTQDLPETLKSLRSRPLFVMRLDVKPMQIVGATPGAFRRVGVIPGGFFEGERLSGVVLDGASDWQTVRNDGATTLNVRLVLKTNDDALISMTYRGYRHGPVGVIARLEKGEVVDPAAIIFEPTPYSKPRRRSTIGSIASSPSASAIAGRTDRSTAFLKSCERSSTVTESRRLLSKSRHILR